MGDGTPTRGGPGAVVEGVAMWDRLRAGRLAIVLASMGVAAATGGTAIAACGDGIRDSGEACDDGNAAGGDCCSATCEPAEDADPCDDGRSCTADDACIAGTCMGVPSGALCSLLLERLVCWGARGRGFPTRKGEIVADEFRAETTGVGLDVLAPTLLCGAAVPDDAGRSVAPASRVRRARLRPGILPAEVRK
jgi:cysteine-rich repeat protein